MICFCDPFQDSMKFCNQTIFETTNGYEMIYIGFNALFYLTFLVFYSYEFVGDLKKKISPILITKGIKIIYLIVRLIEMIVWVVSSVGKTAEYGKVFVVLTTFGIVIFVVSSILIVISWLHMILRAKNVGDKSKILESINKTIYISLMVITPIVLASVVAYQFVPIVVNIFAAGTITLVALMVISMIVATVYLVIILKWIGDDPKSNIQKKIKKRSKWIIVIIVMVTMAGILLAINFTMNVTEPIRLIVLTIVHRSVENAATFSMFFFLENHISRAWKKRELRFYPSSTPQHQSSEPRTESTLTLPEQTVDPNH